MVLWLLLFFATGFNAAAPPSPAGQRSLSAEETLALPAASGTLERMPLREVLNVLANPGQAAIFLDRRINPDSLVSVTFPDAVLAETLPATTLQEVLEDLGQKHGFVVAPIETVIYLGPGETASRLRTLDRLRRDEARKLPPADARGLLASATLDWSDLASPRELVEEVCRRANLSLANAGQIPHDLWAKGRLPNLSRVTQLTILLAGFDLTFQFTDRDEITMRPIRGDERWQQIYPLPSARAGLVDEMHAALPRTLLKVDGDKLHVAGMVEDHEIIRHWLEQGRSPSGSARVVVPRREPADSKSLSTRYTLRVVRRRLGEVLQEIERTTDYRFAYDGGRAEENAAPLDQVVSFEVQDVDVDGLMRALLEPAGLTFRRAGTHIEIFAGRAKGE